MREKVKNALERFLVGLTTVEEFNREIDDAWSDAYTRTMELCESVGPDLRGELLKVL